KFCRHCLRRSIIEQWRLGPFTCERKETSFDSALQERANHRGLFSVARDPTMLCLPYDSQITAEARHFVGASKGRHHCYICNYNHGAVFNLPLQTACKVIGCDWSRQGLAMSNWVARAVRRLDEAGDKGVVTGAVLAGIAANLLLAAALLLE